MKAELTRKGLWTGVIEIVVDEEGKTKEDISKEYASKLVKCKTEKMAEA